MSLRVVCILFQKIFIRNLLPCLVSLSLAFCIPATAFADSFVEPQKPQYPFTVFPKSVTKYKSMGVKTDSVEKLYVEQKKIYVEAKKVSHLAGFASFCPAPQVKVVGKVIKTSSKVTYKIAGYCMNSLSKFKKGVKLKTKTEWKWVRTYSPYIMKMRTTQWYEYKGKAISEKTTRVYTRVM